jgi:hypothetical protein
LVQQKKLGVITRLMRVITKVVYHGVTSSFFGIGILPVSDLLGGRYFRSLLLIWAGTPFFRKRGAGCVEKGAGAPFILNKGANVPFLREKGVPAKKMIPK